MKVNSLTLGCSWGAAEYKSGVEGRGLKFHLGSGPNFQTASSVTSGKSVSGNQEY